MDGEPTFPAGSRRARVALLVAGAVVLATTAVGVRAALGGHDRPPGQVPDVAAAGTTAGGQETGATADGGGPGGQPAPGGGTGGGGTGGGSSGGGTGGGGTGGGGTPPTTTSPPTTTAAPTTTTPRFEVAATSALGPKVECNEQPNGRWHFRAEFIVVIYTKDAGTVRYQWGRGGGDVRSDVRTYDIDKRSANDTTLRPVSDTISGSSDSPTDTVIDRLHVLDPYGRGGPVDVEVTSKICP